MLHCVLGVLETVDVDASGYVRGCSCQTTTVADATEALWERAHQHLRVQLEASGQLRPADVLCRVTDSLPHPWIVHVDHTVGQLWGSRVDVRLEVGEKVPLVAAKRLAHGGQPMWSRCPYDKPVVSVVEPLPAVPSSSAVLAAVAVLLRQWAGVDGAPAICSRSRALEAIFYLLWLDKLARMPQTMASATQALHAQPLLLDLLLEAVGGASVPHPLLDAVVAPQMPDALSVAMDSLTEEHSHQRESTRVAQIAAAGLAALMCAPPELQRQYSCLPTVAARKACALALLPPPEGRSWTRLLADCELLSVTLKCSIVTLPGRAAVVDACCEQFLASPEQQQAFRTFVYDSLAELDYSGANKVVSVTTKRTTAALVGTSDAQLPPFVSFYGSTVIMPVEAAAAWCTNLQSVLMRQVAELHAVKGIQPFYLMYLCPTHGSFMDLGRSGLFWTATLQRRLAAFDILLTHDWRINRLTSVRGAVFVLVSPSPFLHRFVHDRLLRQTDVIGQLLCTETALQACASKSDISLLISLAERIAPCGYPAPSVSSQQLPRPCGGIPELRFMLSASTCRMDYVGVLPVELCRQQLVAHEGKPSADLWTLVASWLLHHDTWFDRIRVEAASVGTGVLAVQGTFSPSNWHPDHPAAALLEAVCFLRIVGNAAELSASCWFSDLRAYALAFELQLAGRVLALEEVVLPPVPHARAKPRSVPFPWAVLSDDFGPFRPHWFLATGPAPASRLANEFGRRLLGAHPKPVLWDEYNGVIRLGVADDDVKLASRVPCMINNTPVVLMFNEDERSIRSYGCRWMLEPSDACALNATVALCGRDFFDRHPHVLALTGGFRQLGGAVFYSEPPRLVAFVPATAAATPVSTRIGGWLVDVEVAPTLADRLLIRADGPDEDYVFESKACFSLQAPSHLRIGDWTVRRDAKGKEYTKSKGTLGCFARRRADDRIVALTAGHCILTSQTLVADNDQYFIKKPDVFLATGRAVVCCYTEHYDRQSPAFQEADDAHFAAAVGPVLPPSRMDTVDCGYWLLDDAQGVDACSIGTDVDWAHMQHNPVHFSGATAALNLDNLPKEHIPDNVLFKFGRTTALTAGALYNTYLFTPGPPGSEPLLRLKVRGWMGQGRFGSPGDSGSLVVDVRGDTVGILTQSWQPQGFEVVEPIGEVMATLDIKCLLGTTSANVET